VDIYSETNRDTENTAVPKANANKLKEGTFALYDSTGTNKLGTLKENEKGTVSWTSVDAGIVAGGTYIVKCEDPPPGYGAAAITVELTSYQTDEYGNSVYTAYLFLDKSPFQLPSAGGTPVTGYTVFGISTMLLAAFLLFLYVSSKSEENENE
jgi:LPXTG-motif cell wall-anchored protein